MALSQKTKDIMIVALANKVAGQELAAAVEGGADAAAGSASAAASSASAAASSASAAAASASAIDAAATAVADIASPSTATAEDCANKINELLAALRAIV